MFIGGCYLYASNCENQGPLALFARPYRTCIYNAGVFTSANERGFLLHLHLPLPIAQSESNTRVVYLCGMRLSFIG